jgi:hypothetical protein
MSSGARLACLGCLALLASSCAETEVAGREILRLGPYRDASVAPVIEPQGDVKLKAGRDVLRQDERQDVVGALGPAFVDEVTRRSRGGAPLPARARLVQCKVRAGFTQRNTIYEARCRAVIEKDGVAVIEVEGLAVRKTRLNAITEADVEELKEDPRHPGFDVDDTEAVLIEAARTAARLLVDPTFHPRPGRPDRNELEEEQSPRPEVDQDLQRRAALRQLKSATRPDVRAAAAVDLARWGRSDDVLLIIPLLSDPSPLVRQAAAVALGELGSAEAIVPLAALEGETEQERVRAAARRALDRLCALYARPSKSSTPGVRVEGVTPADDKNDSTVAQNEVCSKR